MVREHSRREAIKTFGRAAAIGAAEAAIIGLAVHATQAHSATPAHQAVFDNDAAILAAFNRWTEAYRVIERRSSQKETAEDAAAWDVIDAAETFIERTPAKSPKAAECALWVSLAHCQDSEIATADYVNRDVAALVANTRQDWTTKLLVRGIANLRSMQEA